MSQDLGYQIFATMSTFYVPSVVIIFLYWKIYQVSVFNDYSRKIMIFKDLKVENINLVMSAESVNHKK